MSFKFKPVSKTDLSSIVQKAPARGRTSKGMQLVQEFLASGEAAAEVDFEQAKERNSVKTSVANFVRTSGDKIWVRNAGDTAILLINVDLAPADVKKAYESRPRGPRAAKA